MAPDEIPNVYAYLGRRFLSAYNDRHKDIPDYNLVELWPIFRDEEETSVLPVCIIGAGLAGLYTAMILESLGISYHIVDADTRERVGGRFFTYRFPNGGPYDYYVPKSTRSVHAELLLLLCRTSGQCGSRTHHS